jgi:transposase
MKNKPSISPRATQCEYSPHKRTRIVTAYNLGLSKRALWAKEGVIPASVKGIVKRYKTQKSAKSLPRSGRPRALNERDLRHIDNAITKDPFISANELKKECGLSCHFRTITRELQRRGIQHCQALRRPKLTEEVAAKRLAFAEAHIEKPVRGGSVGSSQMSPQLLVAKGSVRHGFFAVL